MIQELKQRDLSIDLIKFFAVFLIINSHMDALYPKYSVLATGGSIGDALFLFCSGFTLFMGKSLRFDNWYKRRINRIYPSVIVCALIGCLFKDTNNLNILTLGGGEFVIAIMIYYILLFFIRKYLLTHLKGILYAVLFIAIMVYIFFFPYKYETGEKGLYGITTLYRWIPYFGMMLLGAICGLRRINLKSCLWKDIILFAISLITFYSIQFFAKQYSIMAPWQIVTLLPLTGIVYYFYKICNASFWKRSMKKPIFYGIVMFVSGICLESYLIQYSLFTTSMNGIFPLNLPIMIAIVIAVSFICKCLSRFFSQTFKDGDYDYKEIIKLY